MTVEERLSLFEPAVFATGQSLDTSLADDFLKAFTRMARAQVKTQQAVALSVEDVRRALSDQQTLIDEVKEQRRSAERKNEQLVRFILETIDLVLNFGRAAQEAQNADLISVSETMTRALRSNMETIGLNTIPAQGQEPDSLYHFVLSTRAAEKPTQMGRIVEVVRSGYLLDGNVIRKADVIVAQ